MIQPVLLDRIPVNVNVIEESGIVEVVVAKIGEVKFLSAGCYGSNIMSKHGVHCG